MPVVDITKDLDALTLTIVADFAAPVERVWQLYADPRQLEQVWGPPEYPATFVDHDLAPGGRVTYYMTSPEGDRYHGCWVVGEVAAPDRFAFDDFFADVDAVGLTREQTFSTWDLRPFTPDAGFVVAVLTRA